MTDKQLKFAIFHVKWGYFGILTAQNTLLRSCLPAPSRAVAKKHLLRDITRAKADSSLLPHLQQKITAYFKGTYVDFSDVRADLSHLTPFAGQVLLTCAKVKYGQTTTYSHLAQMARSPRAARAVGNILAKNPLPLIIPCHRIIRADGSTGGFTAPQGTKLKKRMLKLETTSMQSV
jgi:methylated-DNA-[protein]-cysteine S-methyltransferase